MGLGCVALLNLVHAGNNKKTIANQYMRRLQDVQLGEKEQHVQAQAEKPAAG